MNCIRSTYPARIANAVTVSFFASAVIVYARAALSGVEIVNIVDIATAALIFGIAMLLNGREASIVSEGLRVRRLLVRTTIPFRELISIGTTEYQSLAKGYIMGALWVETKSEAKGGNRYRLAASFRQSDRQAVMLYRQLPSETRARIAPNIQASCDAPIQLKAEATLRP